MKQYQYILTYNSTSETLTKNPSGWKDVGLTFMRHEFYHSVLRSFTLSLRFPNKAGGGYDFISDAYETEGIFAEIGIQIKVRNPNTNAYDAFFTGVLDLTPVKFTIERDFIEVPIIDSSKLQKFVSRDENEIDVLSETTIDGVAITGLKTYAKTLNLTPVDITLKNKLTYNLTEGYSSTNDKLYYYNPTYIIKQTENIVFPESFPGSATIYQNDSGNTINIKLNWVRSFNITAIAAPPFTETPWVDFDWYVDVYDASNSRTRYTINFPHEFTHEEIESQHYYTFVGTNNIYELTTNVASGGRIEIFLALHNWSYIKINSRTESGTLNIIEITEGKEETSHNAYLPFDVFYKMIQHMTDEATSTKVLNSSVLGRSNSIIAYGTNGDASSDMILNGFMVRNYPDAKLNLKFRDLFKSYDAPNNLGVGYDKVNDRFIIEPKATFFDASTTIADLGEVKEFKRQPLNMAYYSKISGGYDNSGDYERVQGALEFNVNREYSTVAKIKESKDIKSTYRYDSVGIEDLRNKQYIDKANEDDNADNDIFIVRSTYAASKFYPLFPSELEFPLDAKGHDVFYSYYNLMLTPRQNAIRWGNVLKACHYKNTKPFKAQKTDKIFELEIGENYTDENSDIALSELSDALFIPELYMFEGYINSTVIAAINANPHGVIKCSFRGVDYIGFIDKIETTSYNKKAKFQLIAAVIPPFNFIFEENIGANYIFEENVNANKTFE